MSEQLNWKSWIENFRDTTLKTYKNEPDRIREDFGSEYRVSDDYKGRALLELLQNADDAQISENEGYLKIGKPEIIFRLTKDAFYCANGGYLMTSKGLNSICRLSHSPKDRSKLTIGEKGLGFKSVLSFSKTPEIHSGDLHCRFNQQDAFKFVFSSEIIKNIRYDLTSDKVPLLRIPIWIEEDTWRNDTVLQELSTKYATIIKLPIFESEFQIIQEKLEEIKSSILLFLNFLNQIIIEIDGIAPKSNKIFRDKKINQKFFEMIPCILDGENSTWTVIRRLYEVPQDKLIGMSLGWENAKECGISFAIQNKNNDYIPLNEDFDNSIRVYFPTDESFPLPILFHATYYTDSSRKHINIEHEYNMYLTKKAVVFFIYTILPALKNNSKIDPCAHLDVLNKSKYNDGKIGKYFSDLLFENLTGIKFIPDSSGKIPKKPSEIKKLSFDASKWEEWYEILGGNGRNQLNLVNLNCTKKNRIKLLSDLQVSSVTKDQIIENLEKNAQKNIDWFIRVYKAINEIDASKNDEMGKTCRQSKLLFTSDNDIVSGNTIKVFMPPDDEKFNSIPSWLNIKFIHPDIVGKLGQNKEIVLNTFFSRFGVKRFQSREILREVISKNINEYWEGKNTSLIPLQLLKFVYGLFNTELKNDLKRTDKQTYEILLQMPVPTKNTNGEFSWSKAGETYFSKNWLKNDFLEQLYDFDPASKFLCDKNYFKNNGFDDKKLFSFFYFIGIENQPRLIEIKKTLSNDYYKEYLSNNNLSEWKFEDVRHSIGYDCTLDRIEAIFEKADKSKILLNYLALNPNLYLNPKKAVFIHIYSRTPDYKNLNVNYFWWLIMNYPWLYDENNMNHKPSEIFRPYKTLKQKFLKYIPFVSYEIEKNQASQQDIESFLSKIGVKADIGDFDIEQWYNIIIEIANKWSGKNIGEDDAEKIRAIYRELLSLDIQINEKVKDIRNKFIEIGKILALYKGKYDFYQIKDVFYVDRLDLFYELKDYVPCFQIQTNRVQKVELLFGVPSLSGSRTIYPDFGSPDNTLSEPLNEFLKEAKPFLLARVRSQRNQKSDISMIKHLNIIPVTKISIKSILKHSISNKEVEIPRKEKDSILSKEDEEKGYFKIYITSILINNATYNDYTKLRNDDAFISEISNRISELLKIDLSEAFQLILSKDKQSRERILKDNHIDEELLKECYTLLEPEESEEETVDEKVKKDTSEPGEKGKGGAREGEEREKKEQGEKGKGRAREVEEGEKEEQGEKGKGRAREGGEGENEEQGEKGKGRA
ncbi:MAG: hypothetical protein Q7J35_16475, partial [Candidatus Methanoperedens sp.]|nr:hypothetical protein [Candidatus Methanoperedens sp.]